MRHFNSAVCLAAILLAAPMGVCAEPASMPQVETPQDQAAMRQWVADTARWTEQHNHVLIARVHHLSALGGGATPIEQLATSGDKAGAAAAAARWKTEQLALLAGDRAAMAAVPPVAALAVNPALLARPDIHEALAGPIAHVEGLPARYAAFMDTSDRQAADYMDTIAAAAASRNPEQAFQLARIGLVISLLDTECALLDTTSQQVGAQRFVSAANIQSDMALAQWYRHLRDLWNQKPQDRPARAAAIHASAAEIRLDADRMVEAAKQQEAENRNNPALDSPAQQDFLTCYRAGFEEAAGIEREMAALLDQLADKITAGEDEAAMALADHTGDISRRRTASQLQRDALLQQLAAPG